VFDRLLCLPQHLLPQHALSRLVGRLAESRNPLVKDRFIGWFARRYGVDLGEAAQPDPRAYPDFNSFFTRALRPGARPLPEQPRVVACPVDGAVSQAGAATDGRLLQAKGHHYRLEDLLGGDPRLAAPFHGGSFATLYLSPRDYHRIHMPLDGRLTTMLHVPGRLFSVNPLTARGVPGLFARNERVVTLFDTAAGPMAVVLVGAVIVASIETVWAGIVTPPSGREIRRWDYPPGEVELARGAELGRFRLGSTVIVLFGPDAVTLESNLASGAEVRMGRPLGCLSGSGDDA
jgi:phosphatidylserine decarboxylase